MPDPMDGRLGSSFRDPCGFVFLDQGVLKRQVNEAYRHDYEALTGSGLGEALMAEGLLISHDDLGDEEARRRGAYKVIRPELVGFISYPYEWCFGQLKDAALATLRIQSLALDHGMTLKDASAFNIQFRGGRPILIDTLSFERLEEGRPWVAYGQFCRHFLAPLALMSTRDVRLGQMSRVFLDGIPLDLASELLSGKSRLKLGLQLHIHSHAKSQLKHAGKGTDRDDVKGRFSMKAFRGLVDNLRSVIESIGWDPAGTEWVNYYEEATHYSESALDVKQRLVDQFVRAVNPGTVWDLGANTGMFSHIAARHAAHTVAFDIDPAAVELHYRANKDRDEPTNVLPLVLDLTNPSPALGWSNRERDSLVGRGPVDLVLALALIHHLAIGNNVPFESVADEFSRLAGSLVIEFVPKDDPKVRFMLASREDIFDRYSQDDFERAFETRFQIKSKEPVGDSGRTLYLMERR